MLEALGYTIHTDGKYGPDTFNDVANFQIINGLSVSGNLDQAGLKQDRYFPKTE